MSKCFKFKLLLSASLLVSSSSLIAAEHNESTEGNQTEAIGSHISEAENFVKNIGNNIIHVLVNKDRPLAQRKEAFKQVLFEYFDMPAIGKFVLSRYWRELSESDQQEYLKLFENSVVENYAAQFDNYNNQQLKVKSSRESSDKGYLVQSQILRPNGGAPLKVEWKIFNTKKGMRVLDIIVDGVSMSMTLRTEYLSVYKDKGGYEGLKTYLHSKIAKPSENLTTVPKA